MKLYRACHGQELSEEVKELWFTSDISYLDSVTWRSVSSIIEIEIDDTVIRTNARRHGKKSLPKQWQSLHAYHAGDNKIQVKFEHGSLNFGFYGSTVAIAQNVINQLVNQ